MAPQDGIENNNLQLFTVEPLSQHKHTIILLHGLGSNGLEFGKGLLETGVTSEGNTLARTFPQARFIFPTAKRRRSSAFGRVKLTQWFDIASLDDPALRQETQLQGLAESSQELMELIDSEAAKVSHENIVLGGISHGCAMALSCLLALDHRLAAFIGMSGWLPFRKDLEDIVKGRNEGCNSDDPFQDFQGQTQEEPIVQVVNLYRDLCCLPEIKPTRTSSSIATPVFLGHGSADEKIRPGLGEAACNALELIGYDVSWVAYEDHGHWYKVPDEIDDMVKFLQRKLGWETAEGYQVERG